MSASKNDHNAPPEGENMRMLRKKRHPIILFLCIAFIGLTAWSATRLRATPVAQEQPSPRVLKREPHPKSEPVGIKKILIRGKTQKANVLFNDTKDFWKGLQIEIYNNSDQ